MSTDLVVIDRARIATINEEHHACETAYGSAVEHAIRCGQLLAAVKAELKHGEWLPWLEKHFDGEQRTAQLYMQLHGGLPNAQRVADFKTDQIPSSIRAAIKELTKPKPKITAKQAYGTVAAGFVDDDEPATGPVSAARLEAAHDRLKAQTSPWTEQHDRKREQIRELLAEADRKMTEASAPGLQPVAVSDLLRSAEIRCRQAQAKIGELAFQFE